MSLVIMNTFIGQDNEVLKELYEVVIVAHNLTNKFQLLDFYFILEKYKHMDGKSAKTWNIPM